MRLLSTSSLKLKEFHGSRPPQYAILSHTWEHEEVLFNDIQNDTASSKRGYNKILGCCQKASSQAIHWVWIDTCCIDKSSSAELSEAINSMYQWYSRALVCYVYLQDVAGLEQTPTSRTPQQNAINNRSAIAKFSFSRWFSRGWTLQELLAPKKVEFYTSDWVEIGTKSSLAPRLSTITGIPTRILRGDHPSTCNVAQRMSWASKRQTQREEDIAYCLLGLFGVNMPLLYGEGSRSFLRLQEQILRQEEDYSILAWTSQHDSGDSIIGALAPSPAEFGKHFRPTFRFPPYISSLNRLESQSPEPCSLPTPSVSTEESGLDEQPYRPVYLRNYHEIVNCDIFKAPNSPKPKEPPQVTSRGLRISLPVKRASLPDMPTLAWIYCESQGRLLCIALQECTSEGVSLVGRSSASWLISVDKSLLPEFELERQFLCMSGTVSGKNTQGELSGESSHRLSASSIVKPFMESRYLRIINSWSVDRSIADGTPSGGGEGHLTVIKCQWTLPPDLILFEVSCGVMNGHPWCSIWEDTDPETGDRSAFHNLAKQSDSFISECSDRAAVRSVQMPGTVLTATINRRLAPGMSAVADLLHHGFSLHVGAQEEEECALWAMACLPAAGTG